MPLDKVSTRKKEGIRTRIVRETGLNQILVRFLLAKSATRGLSVLEFPFSEVTPRITISATRFGIGVPGQLTNAINKETRTHNATMIGGVLS